jgi:hypothetical protein
MRGSPDGACLPGLGSASPQHPACILILRLIHWGVREDVRSRASVSNARQPLCHVDRCLRLTNQTVSALSYHPVADEGNDEQFDIRYLT